MLSGSSRACAPVAIAMGLCVGILTSLLQTWLEFPWLALVNAVSPWLTTAFVAGALQGRMRTAVWVGTAATLMQVVGYYATAQLRGFGVGIDWVVVWSVCAVVGGPLLGAAGHMWRRAAPRGAGAAVLVAAWASEAVVVYQLRLGYTSTAWLFGAVALLLGAGLGRHRGQLTSMTRWLAPALLAGVAGHALLGLVAA